MILLSDETRPQQAVKKPNSLPIVVAVSVLIHAGLIGLMSVPTQQLATRVGPPTQAIKATIVYPSLLDLKERFNADVDEPTSIDDLSNRPQLPQEQTVEEMFSQLEQEPTAETPSGTEDTASVAAEQTTAPVTGARAVNSLDRMRSHLGQLQQQQQHALAQQQASQFQQQKQSPDLRIPDYQTSELPPMVKEKIVNCDQTAANVLRVVSQIAGGNLRCRDTVDFNQYIEDRLEKR